MDECPNCGSLNTIVVSGDPEAGYWQFECEDCGCEWECDEDPDA